MFESRINRGKANGYAPLGSDSKVSLDYLPPFQSTIDTGSFATTSSLQTLIDVTGSFATTSSLQTLIDVTGSFATTGSNQFNGDQSVSGSMTVSGSLTFSATVVNNAVIDAINSDLIIDGGYLILTGSDVPTSLTGMTGDTSGMIILDNSHLYYCTSNYETNQFPPQQIWNTIKLNESPYKNAVIESVDYVAFGSGSWISSPPAEVTMLDIDKSIHLLDMTEIDGASYWYLPDGYDGQVMKFALKGGVTTNQNNNVYVWVDSLRTNDGTIQTNVSWSPFWDGGITPRSLAFAVFVDGAWNIDNDWWGMDMV